MPTQIKVPAVGESIKSVYVADWKKNTGDYCNAGDIICEIETDKASQEIPTEVAGVITTQANVGDELPIGGVLASIDEAGQSPASEPKTKPKPSQAPPPPPAEPAASVEAKPLRQAVEILTTPSAKVHAEEYGIDLAMVAGSGKGGRILKEDVLAAAEKAQATAPESHIASNDNVGSAPKPVAPVAAPAEVGEGTRKRMSMMRRTIANRLVSAQHEAAMLTTFNEADMSQIIDLRKKCQKEFVETHGVKLGFMSLFVKAVVRALKAVPNVNAAIDGTDIVQYLSLIHI